MAAVEDRAPLIWSGGAENDDFSRLLKESKTNCDWQNNSAENLFEIEDEPTIEYDFEVKAPRMIDSLLTLCSVTTFIAGFVAADFSEFAMDDWEDTHWVCPHVYMCMLAFAEGCCLYLSVCGTIAGATYQRAANQLAKWPDLLGAAFGPITSNLGLLKGRRLEAYKAAAAEVLKTGFHGDWARDLIYSGLAKTADDITAEIWIVRKFEGSENGAKPTSWILHVEDPAFRLGTTLGFKFVTGMVFPVAILAYLLAQTLKALKGGKLSMISVVLPPVLYWMVKMLGDLKNMYAKIRD
ncbi:unnamed protein product [Prorocentrum cordatum]|uniref:Uncharacterized protein n=1 Tax=Prorocentrum cordatum TaxID=2364126 RepID=A0ABN9UYU2_9DINO|nr:unnamed protein product [Polarella glacialis]|mmetsp:Transcript_9213/g.24628  ORF Transcript_9213/g.24628 Transcript_9213/m.24628 type:complete len:295 (-) Transcript_9213:105-989(-)